MYIVYKWTGLHAVTKWPCAKWICVQTTCCNMWSCVKCMIIAYRLYMYCTVTCVNSQSTNSSCSWKKTSMDITQSHPLHGTHFGQCQTSLAILGYLGSTDCCLGSQMAGFVYGWFSWGMASLLEGKSRGLQLCVKYGLVSATLSPCHSCLKIKEAASLKVKGSLYSCLLIAHLPSGSKTLNWHLETIHIVIYMYSHVQ